MLPRVRATSLLHIFDVTPQNGGYEEGTHWCVVQCRAGASASGRMARLRDRLEGRTALGSPSTREAGAIARARSRACRIGVIRAELDSNDAALWRPRAE